MKQVRLSVWIGLAVAIAVAALVYFELDFVPVTEDGPWSDEAVRNPFLAAGQLLKKNGHQVDYVPEFGAAPPGSGLLVLNQPGKSLSPQQVVELRHWVRQGNELIVSPSAAFQADDKVPDPLLAPLGVQSYDPDPPPKDGVLRRHRVVAKPDEGKDPDTHWEEGLPWLVLSPAEGNLQTTFNRHTVLVDSRHDAERVLADSNGVHVLRYAVGQGHITVFSDLDILDSHMIHYADNAAVLLYLAQLAGKPHVWMVYHGTYPTLSELLWQYGRPALLSTLLFLAVWLWWSGRRFGPLLPAVVVPRRQLSEHLRACGRYLWYAGQQPRLYKGMRAGLRRHMMRRHPHWRQLSNQDLVRALAEFSGLEAGALQRALIDTPNTDLARFLTDVRVMNHVRKML